MITIQVNDRQVLDVLTELSRKTSNLRPALKEIGLDMVASTKARFATATGPDGTPWEANSSVTIDRFVGLYNKNFRKDGSLVPNKNFKKDGSLTKRGENALASGAVKKPLTGKMEALQTTINHQLVGSTGVSIGSPIVYAAIQQFGGTKAQFPHLWGDIPARPFLGMSDADKTNILDIIGRYLAP
ncbi:MAG: phage virion morphogenesis protein [Rhodoferax sp.]|nr:phage virion morphogenesis protein [Rhodoferax sp.]